MTTPREIIAEATRAVCARTEEEAREEYQQLIDRVNHTTDREIDEAARALKGGKP